MALREFKKFLEKPDTLHNNDNNDVDDDDNSDVDDRLFPRICENTDGILWKPDHNFNAWAFCLEGDHCASHDPKIWTCSQALV